MRVHLTLISGLLLALALPLGAEAKPPVSQAAYWARVATSGDLAAKLEKVALPKKARKHLTLRKKLAGGVRNVQSGTATLSDRLETAAGQRTTRRLTIGSPTVTTGPDGLTASANLTYDDPSSTTSSTVEITMHVPPDASSLDFTLGGTVTDKKSGRSKSNSMSFPISFKPDANQVCPTATGDITRAGTTKFSYVTKQVKPEPLVDFINETVGYEGKLTVTGEVGRDAKLQSLKYQFDGALDWTFNASGLLGLAKVNRKLTIGVDASGTVDPSSGAVSGSKTTLTPSKVSQKGLTLMSDKTLATEGTASVRSAIEKLVSDTLGYQFKAFKAAETKWRTPNACATLTLDPAAGGELASGATKTVNGTVKAKDGTPADADWTLTSVSPGSVAGLPGSSAGATPLPLTMTVGTADAGKPSVNAAVQVTSPAGIATGTWQATAPEDANLYFRVVGTSVNQAANGTLTDSTRGCVSGPTAEVGPWTFNLQQTTGEPDGSVEREGKHLSGFLRATGTAVRPPWTWKQVCPEGSQTQAKDAITYTGQFGPTLSFDGSTTDPSQVLVRYSSLSPSALFDHQVVGPKCDPITSNDWVSTVPLATLQQRTPFTLSKTVNWTIDSTAVNGRTQCTGTTSVSVTLQRVKEDGSPL